MIQINDPLLYSRFKQNLKDYKMSVDELQQTLTALHPEYYKLLFMNEDSKKLYNQKLNFVHILCKSRNIIFFNELCSKDPSFIEENLNKTNNIGWTPIYFSIKKKDIEFIIKLISMNASLKPAEYASPLILACQYGDRELFDIILEHSDSETVQYQDNDGINALFMAIYVQKIEFIQILLKKNHIKTRVFDKKGASLLHWAANTENFVIFQYLLEEAGIEDLINIQDNDGNTVLHYLAQVCDKSELFDEFINKGGNPYLRNVEGLLAVDLAQEHENFLGQEILQMKTCILQENDEWCTLI